MNRLEKQSDWDVVVAGGGTAGVVAAIQAGRCGARVLLVEKNGMLGGSATVAGVAFPGLFHAWGRQVIAGIGWELVARCVRECGLPMPDFTTPAQGHWQHQVRINGPIYAALCDEAVTGAGVDLLLHAMPVAAMRQGGRWQATLATKSGLRVVTAGVLLDCTGDANLTALAGAELRIPDEVQPGTLMCRAEGYHPGTLDMNMLNRRFVEAVAAGELSAADACWNMLQPDLQWVRKMGSNAGHVDAHETQTSEGRTRLELDARRSLLRLFRFLRRQPGMETLSLNWMAAECGVRESVTIVGRNTVTESDYRSGRLWPDALCYAYYPIDIHQSAGLGLCFQNIPDGVVPTVPMGALIPRRTEALLVAGRCLSSDRPANSALRVQATCMATGQAAGAIAALAATTQTPIESLSVGRIKELLCLHGAIVPPDPPANVRECS